MSNKHTIKILHLSDLHFGWDGNQTEKDNRKIALSNLLNTISALDTSWKPNCVCISGDIGWSGSSVDYNEASDWIKKLLNILDLTTESLFLCPGNHDVNREITLQNIRPSNSKDADRILKIPIPEHYLKPFGEYSKFCDIIGIPKLKLGESESNLFGVRKFNSISFVSINTAWFSQDNNDRGNLWLGLPLIKHLFASEQLPLIDSQNSEICIALLHHPKEWLSESEQRADDSGRENTFDYLSRRCNLILTGHTHGEVRKADRFAEGAWHLSGGAAYAGASHFNSFRIIKVEGDRFVYRSFEYDPRSSDNHWLPKDEPTNLNFFFSINNKAEEKQEISSSLNIYREKSLLSAQQLIQDKSRAIKHFGDLPETLPLEVVQINKGQHYNFSSNHNLIRSRQNEIKLPLSVAVKRSRKTLILGDLGSGKSTLSAAYIQNTLQENIKSFAIIIPATAINETPYLTIKNFLKSVSNFYNEQIDPSGLQINIEKLLSEKIETTILIDGLDEVSHSYAVKILERLADIADNWSNVQVLATGRPIELQGINYGKWNTLLVSSLDEDKKHLFLKEEAKSEGHLESEANGIADKLLNRLKDLPNLNQLANTPLVIRLIYPRLFRSENGESLSLGDILYDLVHERLGEWNLRDRKESATRNFETEFPDAFSRAFLFGQLALIFSTKETLTIDAVKFQLQNLIKNYSKVHFYNLAGEAYDFLLKTGLVTTSASNQIEFTFQPLFETLSGLGLVALLQQNSIDSKKLELIHWRVISFFATSLRRKGLLEANISLLEDYIKQIFIASDDVPIIAYVISESQNKVLANIFIEIIDKLESDPIVFLQNERTQSARAMAETLKLAGQKGFDWYYSRYLNPRYPDIRRGSWGIDEVFIQWALISKSNIDEYEKEKLRSVVRPHIQSGSAKLISTIRVIAILIPDAFSDEERLWFYASLLSNSDYSPIVEKLLREAHKNGNKEKVNKVLKEHAKIGFENSAESVHLWLKLNQEIPPITLIKSLIRYRGYTNTYRDLANAIEEVVKRIGLETWKAFLRFCLFASDTSLGSGAAIELYNLGERSLNLLIPPLLNDMHDGKSSRHIEQILNQLLYEKNQAFLRNLAQKIASKADDYSDLGAPSGLWRLFLSRLLSSENGAELLASSVGGIGTFIFPRYPEIRQQYRDLLESKNGKKYQESLFEKLSDFDPKIRLGAAMILAICSPNQESRAIDIILNYDYRRGMWYEWLNFLLTISFEPSILAYIKSKVSHTTSNGQALALAILHHNNIQLETSEYELLSEAIVDIRKIGFISDKNLISTDFAFKSLLKTISGNSIDKSSRASNYLLEYHSENLSIEQKAMCAILYLENRTFQSDFLEKQITLIKTDKVYEEKVKESYDIVTSRLGKKPLLELIHWSIIEQSSWGEVVWRLICDDSNRMSHEIEDAGNWLLNYGKFNSAAGNKIGIAAKNFFEKEEGFYSRIEIKQWLAILADEFIGLPSQALKSLLSFDGSFFSSTGTAIIARIGEETYDFKPRQTVGSVPNSIYEDSGQETRSELITKLNEQTFDSDKINPQLCEMIEKSLLYSPLTKNEITKISANGRFGLLAITILSFVRGKKVAIKNCLKIFEIRIFDKDQGALQLINLCKYGLASTLENSHVNTNKYLKLLDAQLKDKGESIVFVANEILRLTGKLEDSQLRIVFDYLTSDLPNHQNDRIEENLVDWIANLDKKTHSIDLAEEIKLAIKTLHSSSSIKIGFKSPFYYLFFPLAYWKAQGKNDDISTQVFLMGLKFTFLRHSHNEGTEKTSKILKKIQPLLTKVPKQIVEQTIEDGKQVEDPEVRAICRLLVLKG